MTINQILKMNIADVNAMSEKELRKTIGQMRKVSSQRLNALKQRKLKTQAVRQLERSGGKISTKGKDLPALKAEFFRAKAFLNQKGSTVRGAKKEKTNWMQGLEKLGEKLSVTPSQAENIVTLLDELKSVRPDFGFAGMRYRIMSILAQYERSDSRYSNAQQIIDDLDKQLTQEYEAQARQDVDLISEFFES